MPIEAITVGELVQGIRRLVEGVAEWQRLWVMGELSSVKHHSSGHWYFVLKDDQAQIRAVMFRRDASALEGPLQDGMAVMAYGRIGVYERDGQTQFYVSLIRELGRGAQDLAFEALKRRLYTEGLFSRPKRALPLVPRAVAVVTSPTGAARHDIETVIHRRFPGMPVLLYPVLVQGREAPVSIADALAQVARGPADVVIIGRGGGAKDDLAAFNDELVVRAVFNTPLPVISAIGHEIDTTLVDLVADLRAPTPSAAAELAVPERAQLAAWQDTLLRRASDALRRRVNWERERLAAWVDHGLLAHPESLFRERRHQLDRIVERADRAYERCLAQTRMRYQRVKTSLPLLNPELPLQRGYTYVTNSQGELVRRDAVQWKQAYQVHWQDGALWMTRTDRGERRE